MNHNVEAEYGKPRGEISRLRETFYLWTKRNDERKQGFLSSSSETQKRRNADRLLRSSSSFGLKVPEVRKN